MYKNETARPHGDLARAGGLFGRLRKKLKLVVDKLNVCLYYDNHAFVTRIKKNKPKEGCPIFEQHKLEAFTAPIASLPDIPRLSATLMKRAFDAPAEELRRKHNALCDDAAQLDTRVSGIIDQTFEGNVKEGMLDPALLSKIAAKAEKTALSALDSKTASADAKLQTSLNGLDKRLQDAELFVSHGYEIVFGSYTGTGTYPRSVSLGFRSVAVFISQANGSASTDVSAVFLLDGQTSTMGAITTTGFELKAHEHSNLNSNNQLYIYMAFK